MTENTPSGPAGPEPTPGRPEQGQSRPSPWSAAGSGHQGAASSADPGTGEHPAAAGSTTGEPPAVASGAPGPSGHPGPGTGEQPAASYGGYPPPPGPGDQPGYPAGFATGPHPTQQQPLAYPGAAPQLQPQPRSQPRPKGRAGLIAGIAALALVVGGAAGGGVGYLVAGNSGGTAYSSLSAPEPAAQAAAPAGSVAQVSQKVLPTVVEIAAVYTQNGQPAGDTGSGVIISGDGNILTNNHVVAGAAGGGGQLQVVLQNGKTVDATVVGRDPTSDLAVIRAKGLSGLPTAQLGRSDDLQVGQEVAAIGAPFQLQGTVTAGIVSSLHRATAASDGGDSQATVMDAIQTDAPINPGNSGGPLVNMQGQVVGINSATYSPSSGQQGGQASNIGIGFAIPINQAKRTADQIVKTGQATQTVLGVKVEDSTPKGNTPSVLTNGALISDVTAGGPAEKAGLKSGSVVVKADDRLITNADDLVAAVHAASPGDQLKLTLADGSTVTVALAGQPVQAGN